MTLDWTPLIAKNRIRFLELEETISQGDLFADPEKARVTLREHSRLKKLIEQADIHEKTRRQLEENREMASGDDPEMAELAAAEIPELETRLETVATEIQLVLLPPEAADNRNAIVEIRAGAGGNEAALFAADLCRMYSRYAETKGWRIEEMESSPAELGGVKEVILLVSGEAVFRDLRYESGVHRVQRVPLTEAQGRIHTSAATVAVLPEAEEVDVEIRPDDLRIEVCRAGGPGGQGVNTTDSAVQILHIPTGKIVRCQDGRSQQKNKEKALKILRARLLEEKQAEEHEKYAAHRRSQIGTGGREEKIRTYNFPQNRVTDHRIGYTMYNLEGFVQGDLDTMLRSLQIKDMENKLLDALAAA